MGEPNTNFVELNEIFVEPYFEKMVSNKKTMFGGGESAIRAQNACPLKITVITGIPIKMLNLRLFWDVKTIIFVKFKINFFKK